MSDDLFDAVAASVQSVPKESVLDPYSRNAIYDDMKQRLKDIGYKMAEFGDFIGVARTTIPKWRSVGTPPYALNILAMLEKYSVQPSWKTSRSQPAASKNDAVHALRQATTAVIDEAIAKGWSRGQIAHALQTYAVETDPSIGR